MNNKLSLKDAYDALFDASEGLEVADDGFVFLRAVIDALYDLRLDKEKDGLNLQHATRKAHSLIRLGHYVATMWGDGNDSYSKRARATLEALGVQCISD